MFQSEFEIIKNIIQSLLLSMLVVSCDDVRRNRFFNFLVGLPMIFDKLPLLSRLLWCISSGKMSSSSSFKILFVTYNQCRVTTLHSSTPRKDESTGCVEINLLQNDVLELRIPLSAHKNCKQFKWPYNIFNYIDFSLVWINLWYK